MAVKVLIASWSAENCSNRDFVCAIVWLNSANERASCAEWRSLACAAMVESMIGREKFTENEIASLSVFDGMMRFASRLCMATHGPHFPGRGHS